MKTASWVIVRKADGVAIFETFTPAVVARLNTDKYEAVPILEHLQRINTKARPDGRQSAYARWFGYDENGE